MIRIVFLLAFLFISGISLAQTENVNKVPQIPGADQGKKVGISSAARRSSMIGRVQPNSRVDTDPDNPGANGPENHPHGGAPGNPNRPDVKVPKNRPGGPITRPGVGPGGTRPVGPGRPNTTPGKRPNAPGQRPPGG